jgi:hypothetical protein
MKSENAWLDCWKILPYRDENGRWQIPRHTQKKIQLIDGKTVTVYRERQMTDQEWVDSQV